MAEKVNQFTTHRRFIMTIPYLMNHAFLFTEIGTLLITDFGTLLFSGYNCRKDAHDRWDTFVLKDLVFLVSAKSALANRQALLQSWTVRLDV